MYHKLDISLTPDLLVAFQSAVLLFSVQSLYHMMDDEAEYFLW